MDPTIHQNLVSMMEAIEAAAKDPDFRRASPPSPPFHLENVIFVTSHFPRIPNPYQLIHYPLTQLRSIGVALSRPPVVLPVIWHAFDIIGKNKSNDSTSVYTIFVDEGIYVDSFDPFQLPVNCNVEIVGIRNVYLVLVRTPQIYIKGDKRIIFRNLTILDLSYIFNPELPMDVGHCYSVFSANDGALVALEDVRISAPDKIAVVATGRNSRLDVTKSCAKNCAQGFLVDNAARMTLGEQCMFKSISQCADVCDGSSLLITDTFFDNCHEWVITRGSKVELKRCSIIGQESVGQESVGQESVGMSVNTKSSLTVNDTKIYLPVVAVEVAKGSTLQFENNHIKCLVAIQSEFTTTISAHDNVFATEYLIHMSNNAKGSVDFKRNRMETGFETKYILDTKSVKIEDDFDKLKIGHEEFLVEKAPPCRKENLSVFTKKMKAEINENSATQEVARAIRRDGRYKHCGWCAAPEPLSINVDSKISKLKKEKKEKIDKGEGQETGADARPDTSAKKNEMDVVHEPQGVIKAKFKYCSRCNKECYCSKKCQENDWNYHKIICNKEESNIEEISLEFEALMKRYRKASRIENVKYIKTQRHLCNFENCHR